MSARRIGPLALLPRPPLARLAVLLWLLACILGAPGAATLHVLSHANSAAASNKNDAPATHQDEQCELCSAWQELAGALPCAPPRLPATLASALPLAQPAPATPSTTAPRWFHPRAPPIQV